MIFCTLLLAGLPSSASGFSYNLLSNRARQNGAPRSHSVDLKWKASTSRVVGYNVYRADKFEGPYTKLNSFVVLTTTYTDVTVQASHTYFYEVTAVDAQGHESVSTNQVKAVVPSP